MVIVSVTMSIIGSVRLLCFIFIHCPSQVCVFSVHCAHALFAVKTSNHFFLNSQRIQELSVLLQAPSKPHANPPEARPHASSSPPRQHASPHQQGCYRTVGAIQMSSVSTDTLSLIAPQQTRTGLAYGAAAVAPIDQSIPPPSLRCCSCLIRPFIFGAASPMARLDHSQCTSHERDNILEEIARTWRTQIHSDIHFRDSEALPAPLGLSSLTITPHWVTDTPDPGSLYPEGVRIL